MDISQFKVYKTGPYFNLGTIYAVVTGIKSENSSHIETEWFYYVTYTHKNFGFKISSDFFDSIEKLWESYTIGSLQDAIYFNEIVPVLEKIKDFTFYTKVELQEIKSENLVYLGFDNKEFMHYLKKHSRCEELIKLVDILPKIIINREEIN
jgi:hypothetical protein